MDESHNIRIDEARRKVEAGDFREAYDMLVELIADEVPDALYLYSTFSIRGTESEREFELRSIELLTRAAEAGHSAAQFSMGACYEIGDIVDADPTYAASLFRKAATQGHSKAKFRHGLNAYYGSNGIPKDEAAGLGWIRAASEEGVEDAQEFLCRPD